MYTGKWHPLITLLPVCINVVEKEVPESFPHLFGANGQYHKEDHGKTKKKKNIWWIPFLKTFRTCASYARKTDTSPICCSFPLHVWGAFLSRQTSHKSQGHISSPAARRFHTSFLRSFVRWSERRWRSRWRSSVASALEEPGYEPFTGSHRCRSSVHYLTSIQTGDRRPLMAHLSLYSMSSSFSLLAPPRTCVLWLFVLFWKVLSSGFRCLHTWNCPSWFQIVSNCSVLSSPLYIVFSFVSACLRVLICRFCNLVSESSFHEEKWSFW